MEGHVETWVKHAKERQFSPDKIKWLERLSVLCSEIPF
ncbi:hypothetical protein SBA5_160070 [Candidatus Sulfotelmatomonas gaucii]|uniref:Uncharacterized protein n=1 Tax=Candidatus Sulfuritelmatomonas gaucii TaxID=2043161 RepID=A0A2N9L5K2_9BACT|nr:hypothetical protein SBA5_160070 [Candidatus Sulfotelmatomonas gaucii]